MEHDKIILTLELVNKILAYLDGRPHGEVRKLVDLILVEVDTYNKK